jgi:hypothetical protein
MEAPFPDIEVSVPSKTGDFSRDSVSADQSQYLFFIGEHVKFQLSRHGDWNTGNRLYSRIRCGELVRIRR